MAEVEQAAPAPVMGRLRVESQAPLWERRCPLWEPHPLYDIDRAARSHQWGSLTWLAPFRHQGHPAEALCFPRESGA